MSDSSNSWSQPISKHRSQFTMSKFPPPSSVSRGFRADAPAFTPGCAAAIFFHSHSDELRSQDSGSRVPGSPFYNLQTSTFMPPETPDLPDAPRFNVRNAPVTAHSPASCAGQATFSDDSDSAAVEDAQSNLHLGLLQGHSRTVSDITVEDSGMPRMYTSSRPRSRSDAPRSAELCGQSDCYIEELHLFPSVGSTGSSGHHSDLIAPLPRRHLFRQQGVNNQTWSRTPAIEQAVSHTSRVMGGPTTSATINGITASPERMCAGSYEKPELSSSSSSTVRHRHTHSELSQISEERGSTPGGVKLPRDVSDLGHASSDEETQHSRATSKSTISDWRVQGDAPQALRSVMNGFQTKHPSSSSEQRPVLHLSTISKPVAGNGFTGSLTRSGGPSISPAESHLSARSFSTQLDSHTASSFDVSPARQQAKLLAQAIRDGFAEEPILSDAHNPYSLRGRHLSMPTTLHPGSMARVSTTDVVPARPSVAMLDADPLVQQWRRKGKPTLQEVLDNIPFTERTAASQPAEWGVIKIMDIPYGTTKPEVVALLGRNARLVEYPCKGCSWFAIHIIMERSTAKSMDCYVEFETMADAQHAASRFESHSSRSGKRPRIGDRQVTVEYSSQEALMADLFPKAKYVIWQGQQPVIQPSSDSFSSGFRGFVTSEELVMTVKFAENPSRSRFSSKHLQRTFESMISLLAKYPWWMREYYTLGERDTIFRATRDCIRALADQLYRGVAQPPLTHQLLQELFHAGLAAPGFSERQRAEIIHVVGGLVEIPVYVTPVAGVWPFETLRRKDNVSEELVQYVVSLLKEAAGTSSLVDLADRVTDRQTAAYNLNSPFGNMKIPWPRNKETMTMADAARLEWNTVQTLLMKVLV